MINKVKKILQILEITKHPKGGIKYILSGGSSTSSFTLNKTLSNCISDLKSIIDVGANIGQFAIASNKFFPKAQIYSFEPIPEAFKSLEKNTEHIENISTFNIALGSKNEKLEFYQNQHSHSSSALVISEEHKKHFPETRKTKKISVHMAKLDEFAANLNLKKPILLKLDVQGYEKQVLEGAINILNRIDYLLFETSFIEMYNGEPLFNEMHTLVNSYGFEFIAPLGFLKGNNSQIVQMDVLYKKSNSDIGLRRK